MDLPALAGAGGIRSSVGDMLLLARAQLAPPDNPIGKAIALAWKVHQQPLAPGDFAIGLAWHIARDGSTRWHNGQTGGYHSMMLVNRDIETAVVLLTNTATMEADRLAQDIIQMLSGAKVEPRAFEKSVKVSPDVMQAYVGKYELAPEFFLRSPCKATT